VKAVEKVVEAVKKVFKKKPAKLDPVEVIEPQETPKPVIVKTIANNPRPQDTHADKPIAVKGGVYIAVTMDGGFGEISTSKCGPHCLQISDMTKALAAKELQGKAINWATVPYRVRHNLEINGFHAAKWSDIESYLVEWRQ
jgi:hypothetical protein